MSRLWPFKNALLLCAVALTFFFGAPPAMCNEWYGLVGTPGNHFEPWSISGKYCVGFGFLFLKHFLWIT